MIVKGVSDMRSDMGKGGSKCKVSDMKSDMGASVMGNGHSSFEYPHITRPQKDITKVLKGKAPVKASHL